MQHLVDNRYRLLRSLGSGGMADVYLAHDDILDRDVALKVMSSRYASDEEFVERFKREAQSAAALSHPNIVSIFDRGESEDGTYYIAMEYLSGGTLKNRIVKRGALPAHTAAAVALQMAEALRAAHERDVIHRDIKPHNILITGLGDVKVTDFGIARAAASSAMTRTGHILGTAHYISPEQAMGEPVGPASDLYSLGVVLYEMLTGELPFDAETPLGIAMKHVNGHLRQPKDLNPSVPDGINAITLRLLAKNPEDRYASDSELIEDLERVSAGLDPSGATTEMMPHAMAATTRIAPPPPPQRVKKRRRSTAPMLLVLLALLVLAALAWVGYTLLQERQAGKEAPQIGVPALVGMSLEGARDEVGDDFDIEVAKSVSDEKPVDTILGQSPSTGKAEKGSTISVNVVGTRVSEVRDVVGSGRAEAERELNSYGFEVEFDERESSFDDQGQVISQNPSGGKQAEVGSGVTITVGTGPSSVRVPRLYGKTPAQAESVLQGAGLRLGTQNRDYNSDVAEGSIYFQDPSGGENVEPGSAVDVIVSLGPEQVEIPEVYGLSVAAAQTALSNAGLNSTAIEVEGDEAAGTALSTDPEVGVMLDPGSTVSLYYSAGPPPVTTPSPDPSASSGDASSNPEPEPGPDQGGGENTDAQPAADDRPADRPERDTSPQGNGGPDNSGQGSSGQGNGTQNNSGSGNGGGLDTNARLGSGSPE
ncbi:MAG: Stk1 family PASTA domain-containing Ser/Thr kinase [Actinomycetota bacterium]|nr:Stk1 family PASTA domain-containing Ser/Thr kinase [Actinomycetota bacterium]